MDIEHELYTLKAKILRGKHISETFKRELSNDIFDIEQKLVKESDSLPNVRDRLNDFLAKQQDISEEVQKVINEKFWDLI